MDYSSLPWAKFKPTSKELWVIRRLMRQGFKTFNDYSENEMVLWMPMHSWGQFAWTDTFLFYMNRQRGCRMEFRPGNRPELHLVNYFAWPNTKNWEKFDIYMKTCNLVRAIL